MSELSEQNIFDDRVQKEKGKVVSLFKFISELNKLKHKTVFNYKNHLWFLTLSNLHYDPQNIKTYYYDREDEDIDENDLNGGNILLSVHKPEYQPCPKPDSLLKKWLNPGWEDFHNPASHLELLLQKEESDSSKLISSEYGDAMHHEKEIYEDKQNIIRFQDDSIRVKAYNDWIKLRFDWVEKQKIIEKTCNLFSELYRLYFELKREGETEEIIVANGMICDKNNVSVMHPVLTHRVKLDFDDDKNIMYIRDTESESELYSSIFQQLSNNNLSGIKQLNEELQLNDYHPLDRIETPQFLNRLVHQLSSNSLYSNTGIPEGWSKINQILLYWEPCYIVRKRLDGTVKAINTIIENIEETGEIPAPIRDIVSGGKIDITDDIGEESIEELLASVGGESINVLLSKEANKEQLEIARRIENYNAVLVQGPPGTGKTHTIANLLGHFLAQGKSVLVTSHTTKALSVLKEKVAPGLQNLCVSMLDDSNKDMEHSVDGITDYMSNTTSFELKKEIDLIATERQNIMSNLADVRRKMFYIINKECNCLVYNGEEISPSKAAAFLTDRAEELSFIPGKVQVPSAIPLSLNELTKLYRSNVEISITDENELAADLPNPTQLLSPSDFSKVLKLQENARNQVKKIASENGWTVKIIGNEPIIHIVGSFGDINFKCPTAEKIQGLLNYLNSFGKINKWMTAVAIDGKRGGNYRQQWLELIDIIKKVNEYAESLVTEQIGIDVSFVDSSNLKHLKNSFESMHKTFIQKGKLGKIAFMTHKDYAPALNTVLVNGKQAQSAHDCEIILHNIELESLRNQCAVYWDNLMSVHSIPKFYDLDTEHQERIAIKYISAIEYYLEWYSTAYKYLLNMLSSVGISAKAVFNEDRLDSDIEFINKVLYSIENIIPPICKLVLDIIDFWNYSDKIKRTKSVLLCGERINSYICTDIIDAIKQENVSKYVESYALLTEAYRKYDLHNKRNVLLKKLETSAPQWADAIRNRLGIHGQGSVPENIEEAWKWKQLYFIIDEITKMPFGQLHAESIRLSKAYREITAKYAEKKGWYHLLKRTEADIDLKQALQGWKLTVKKIGKGTGKQAPRLKAEARKAMAKCQTGVPAWIMPINRALDNLNPKRNRFDIIIIDEASQSDVSSLAVLYLGKKLIIVGDDKQVSPMAVGEEIDKLQKIEEMYIKGKIPNSHLYNSKTSIYDIAATTFQPLMLREHFRCVPEIIGFSNMLSYDYKIKPLRDASNSMLLPAVVNYRVADGKRERNNKTNVNEAKTIISLMKACMEQPEYADKSFGVISLLGDEQVKLISSYIEKEIEPKEVTKRNIMCGNSANFQGDERDVIFLSVVDSGDGTGPLNMRGYGVDDAYRKRYNVATSRAKDQLWVVHSLDSSVDLKPGDIRKVLIDYSRNPHALEVKREQIVEQSESPFEKAVAMALVSRGYHLVQQWKVGSYRLDMVVVCKSNMVAIECDGERWHSGETKIREDMQRQTILERLGWRFIRIRGSEYYRYPEQTINRVILELTQFGIKPEDSEKNKIEDRNSDLLCRVKNRAAKILNGEIEETIESSYTTIEAALNPKSMIHNQINEDKTISIEVPFPDSSMYLDDQMNNRESLKINDFEEKTMDDLESEKNQDIRSQYEMDLETEETGSDYPMNEEYSNTHQLDESQASDEFEEHNLTQKEVGRFEIDKIDDLEDLLTLENAQQESLIVSKEPLFFKLEKMDNSNIETESLQKVKTKPIETMSLADELIKYKELLDEGILTQEEFNELKHKLLKGF